MLKGLVAGSVNTGLAFALGATWPGAAHLAGILVLGLACYGASLVLFVLALRHIGAARTGASFSIAPFIATAASLIVFRERPTVAFTVAAVLMAIGVWLLVTDSSSDPRDPAQDLSDDSRGEIASGWLRVSARRRGRLTRFAEARVYGSQRPRTRIVTRIVRKRPDHSVRAGQISPPDHQRL